MIVAVSVPLVVPYVAWLSVAVAGTIRLAGIDRQPSTTTSAS